MRAATGFEQLNTTRQVELDRAPPGLDALVEDAARLVVRTGVVDEDVDAIADVGQDAAAQASGSVTSRSTHVPTRQSPATRSAPAVSMSATTTSSACGGQALRAMPSPIPVAAPVTMAVRPVRFSSSPRESSMGVIVGTTRSSPRVGVTTRPHPPCTPPVAHPASRPSPTLHPALHPPCIPPFTHPAPGHDRRTCALLQMSSCNRYF